MSERLGSVPAGLDWIVSNKKNNSEIKIVEQAKSAVAKAQSATVASAKKEESVIEAYEQHLQKTDELYLEMLSAKLTGKVQQPVKKKVKKSVHIGLSEGWTRATIIVKEEHIEKLKEVAKKHDIALKDVVNLALTNFLKTI